MKFSSIPSFLDHFATLAPLYDVVLSDVWGVVHNGVAALPEAGQALSRFREAGGTVVLISNAPRPGRNVVDLLDEFGVVREAYDGIVTSGDVTTNVIAGRPGQTVYHLGPERDRPMYAKLDVRFAPIESADYVVCSGLFNDETETAEDYRDLLGRMRARNLFMVCANPDIVVERGDRLVYCAGAIADLYRDMGGDVLYAGKPYRPIYDQALAAAEAVRGAATPFARVLAIGDSVRTDVTGAASLGVDCLFLTAGIHAEELGGRETPDPAVLQKIFAGAGVMPKAVMRRLAW
jgi:HAD superfamily hydrolase (TIGR01459 family)